MLRPTILRRTSAILRMAARNVLRNKRRTILSAAAIGVCVAFVWISAALTLGMLERTVANATQGFLGHVQVHTRDYADDPRLDNTLPASLVATLESAPSDAASGMGAGKELAIVPRLYGQAYARSGRLGSGSLLLGVDPPRESAMSGLADKLVAGTYLEDHDTRHILVGDGLAERLGVGVGDSLDLVIATVSTVPGVPAMPSMASFEVGGIVDTGIVELDDAAIFMSLTPAQTLTGLDAQIHEIAIRGSDPKQAGELAQALAPVVAAVDERAVVEPWRVLSPDMAMWVDMAGSVFELFAFVLVLVVGTAILLSQSMVVFERRGELGLLRAIGLRPRQLLLVLVVESVLVAAAGALLGLALGGACLAVLTQTGLNLGGGAELEMSGVSISPVVFPTLEAKIPIQALLFTVTLAAISSILAGLRTAIRGHQS